MTEYIKYPRVTEKSVDKMDFENKLVFICHVDSKKGQIAEEIEQRYDVTVEGVSAMVTPRGEKKAEVQLSDDHDAQEIASRIGVF
ncbi:MAG: LSU ribosomal protein L23P [halophilic archaeon J07HX64]|jgi:LSU ribosomal protein L23P|nr:MAG: LSU ribosomal protein L23P [halophilic archaeon J07HX64]